LRGQWAAGAGSAEGGSAAASASAADRDSDVARAGDHACTQVDGEAVFGEPTAGGGRRLHLGHRVHASGFHPGQQLTGAVGSVPVDRGPVTVLVLAVLVLAFALVDLVAAVVALVVVAVGWQGVGEDALGGLAVGGVAGGEVGVGDDLGVRVGGDVAFVPVEPACGGLVPVPGLGVDGGDDPVLGDPAAIRNTPSSPVSRSWPTTVASSAAASAAARPTAWPSSAPSNAIASRASASTSASRATRSSQSQTGLPAPA